MEPGVSWYQDIRDIHDRHFDDPWQERADAINRRYGLAPGHLLLTPGCGVPVPWFVGNIEAVEPGHWVLVISLNHYIDPDAQETLDLYAGAKYTSDRYWDHLRMFNTEHWYQRFFGPLARVAAAALGERLTREQEPGFATNRMIFVEICPYSSQRFDLSWQAVKELLVEDLGFQRAAEVNRLLVDKGRPALVMVNGVGSIDMFKHLNAGSLTWRELRYESCDLPPAGGKQKRLRYYCGSLDLGHRPVPVVGFPFLRTPRTANSDAEVAQLGGLVRQCVEGQLSA